jgi:dihydropteroate synthase
MIFRARQFEFVFPRPALVMGVVNVTPDSFSDGGNFLDVSDAVAHALKLVAQGADILDIGGESTRPGAQPVSEADELQRVITVIEKLAPQISIPISIDTTKPAVAHAALAAGASIVNDVSGNRDNDDLWKVVSDFHAGYVCMHAAASGKDFAGENIIGEVGEFFQEQLGNLLNRIGVIPEQVVLDVGIGFGKTLEQNLSLLAGLRSFKKLRRPLLLGVSRKSFIGKLLGAEVNERLPASLACATLAVEAGVQIIRTHDVAETVQAVRLTEALLARRKN